MKKLLITTALSVALINPALASEVYINQAGGALTVDVLQESGMNRVNTESNPFDIDGDDITVNLTQSGDGNEADLELEMGASQTNLVYSATGDYNTIVGQIYGGINNSFVTTIVGSDNVMTYCRTYVNSACNGIIVNNTDTAGHSSLMINFVHAPNLGSVYEEPP
jgi:opacity protein-like surface antigen